MNDSEWPKTAEDVKEWILSRTFPMEITTERGKDFVQMAAGFCSSVLSARYDARGDCFRVEMGLASTVSPVALEIVLRDGVQRTGCVLLHDDFTTLPQPDRVIVQLALRASDFSPLGPIQDFDGSRWLF